MNKSKCKGWTSWKSLNELDLSKVTTSAGVYKIAASKKLPLPRVKKPDVTGILDIGESKCLRNRLKMFYKSARGNKKVAHSAGRRYLLFNMNRLIPFEELRVKWKPLDSKDKAKNMEGDLQRKYIKDYGELPPLNAKLTEKKSES